MWHLLKYWEKEIQLYLEIITYDPEFRAFFNISRTNSKTSKLNQQSVSNLYIFHFLPKNLDRTITFNSVTLKNTQTEPKNYFFQRNK